MNKFFDIFNLKNKRMPMPAKDDTGQAFECESTLSTTQTCVENHDLQFKDGSSANIDQYWSL